MKIAVTLNEKGGNNSYILDNIDAVSDPNEEQFVEVRYNKGKDRMFINRDYILDMSITASDGYSLGDEVVKADDN